MPVLRGIFRNQIGLVWVLDAFRVAQFDLPSLPHRFQVAAGQFPWVTASEHLAEFGGRKGAQGAQFEDEPPQDGLSGFGAYSTPIRPPIPRAFGH